MAKKKSNPELLVAEIHIQQSKIQTLKAQYSANKQKIDRLTATNASIQSKATRLQAVLDRNIALAQQLGLKF